MVPDFELGKTLVAQTGLRMSSGEKQGGENLPDYFGITMLRGTKCWREAAFVACKKAKQSSLTSSRGPKASRQKTSDPSNREHKTTCEERKVAAGQLF